MKVKELINELQKFDDNLDIDVFEYTDVYNPGFKVKQVGNRCIIYKGLY